MQTNIVADFLGLEYTGLKQTHTQTFLMVFVFMVCIFCGYTGVEK